ncbi:MAG: hypothetical protein QOD12_945 [Verrucomicrobiota bacterium]
METTKGNHKLIEHEGGWRARTDWSWLALLVCIVAVTWCAAYNRWTSTAWATPVSYNEDTWFQLATTKAFATGEAPPILPKYPASLGAPFSANWNDYPSVEEGMFVWTGVLARVFGPLPGANVALLSASLLAAASFYFACRQFGSHPAVSVAGAALFSLSRFAFARSLHHLSLTFYWHLPLGVLVIWYCLTRPTLDRERRLVLFCVAVAILHGVQNIYYTGMFLQFLAGISCYHALRREPWRRIVFPLFLAAIAVFTVGLMNIDTLSSRLANGPNPFVIVRNYAGGELYALKPIELIVPVVHRITALGDWGMNHYAKQAYVVGELGSPYLGIVGIAALLLLVWEAARHLASQNLKQVPFQLWFVLWTLAFSVIGGLNALLAVCGLVLFRGSNRYSIVILTLVLLFLVRYLSSFTRNWKKVPLLTLAGSIMVVGLLDQIPSSPTGESIAEIRKLVRSDARMAATLETKLPPNAMVFQLPIMEFPEVPPLRGVASYEHFRPYLFSQHLRYSYGSDKGRTRERWQTEAEQFGVPHLIGVLEQYGFSAILINRKGYEDGGAAFLEALRSLGKAELLVDSEFICAALTPATRPFLPPDFDENWYGLEGRAAHDWRWSSGDATIVLYNPESGPRQARLSFRLENLQPRRLQIALGSRKIYGNSFQPGMVAQPIDLTVMLSPGKNVVRFKSSAPGAFPGTSDTRKLAFALHDFRLLE